MSVTVQVVSETLRLLINAAIADWGSPIAALFFAQDCRGWNQDFPGEFPPPKCRALTMFRSLILFPRRICKVCSPDSCKFLQF